MLYPIKIILLKLNFNVFIAKSNTIYISIIIYLSLQIPLYSPNPIYSYNKIFIFKLKATSNIYKYIYPISQEFPWEKIKRIFDYFCVYLIKIIGIILFIYSAFISIFVFIISLSFTTLPNQKSIRSTLFLLIM